VVTIVADNAEYEAQEQGKAVRFECLADPVVMGDAELLTSAVDNVVRNALRYTPASSSVDIRLAVADQEAVVTVRDHGPGVPEAELERIFTPFHRVDTGRDRAAGGAGLGLAIARRAVALHKGSLAAALADSGGLVVTMRLPLTPVSHAVHTR
jgi:two-component system sensor histidine kinase CpxA